MRDLSTNLSHVSTVSEKHEAKYNDWLTTAGVRNKQRAREKGRRTVHLRQCVALLDTAAYAVRFAVASYGLPYELGYFNSVREIMKLVGKPHQRYTVASSEEQLESMRRMLQGECAEPLMEYAHGRFTNQPPHPSFAIVLDHEARRVVVTFRGTETVADALVDITEGYVVVDLLSRGPHIVGVEVEKARSAVPLAEAPPKVRVRLERLTRQLRAIAHTPAAFKKVDSEERKEADPSLCTRVPLGFFESVVQGAVVLLPLLEEVYAQYPDYDLFLTGHSLGGIQATLFHLFFCFSAVPDSAEEARPHQKHRLTYRTDTTQLLVPFRRTFTLTFGAAPVVEEQLLSAVNAALQREEDRSGSRLLHFMFGKDAITRLQVRSIRDLLTEEPLADAVLPTLALPGSVYLIPEGHKDFFTVEESDTVRKELVVSVDSVIHHFPLFYLRSINHLLKQYTHRWVQATNNNNKAS
ncbi:hypothetical protein AGDE_07218 [Angomonas deanei]|uniref:sn-1-specific diacylglycerol lipase n=1 Tax=Angomonas deanei TaxID=59799 RepID=A0A7G2CD03_9TRYP|nr:hypothetical protein AGDE_07218 [Angomonas deanei]CAD2216002.1 Lipase (class 3), putative [Angomonas deanei]|eukprot:EPY35829.1 hypothetical protein AGDE_07218 [Angomonas deanei]